MTKDQMNALYAAYPSSPDALEALLVAVRCRAGNVMRDEDAAQEFTIGVWRALPIPHDENFSAWLNVRLRMMTLKWIRDKEDPVEILFCEMENAYER